MKSETKKQLQDHKVQILSNSLRLQALLETLVDTELIDAELFNELVKTKYDALNKEIVDDIKSRKKDKDIDDIITHYGSMGEA